ncbi:hypothetical protein EVAR_60200_1 [Eumeta japonica]|uniref:Uncharacterized protein n=1 Tax=Eumeta variegata TaxID=151549 RepID=A0A4C1Z6N0_EUMVA|nr:hypothetical protein EVAR_60200_1 [Eumeta japonica]
MVKTTIGKLFYKNQKDDSITERQREACASAARPTTSQCQIIFGRPRAAALPTGRQAHSYIISLINILKVGTGYSISFVNDAAIRRRVRGIGLRPKLLRGRILGARNRRSPTTLDQVGTPPVGGRAALRATWPGHRHLTS